MFINNETKTKLWILAAVAVLGAFSINQINPEGGFDNSYVTTQQMD